MSFGNYNTYLGNNQYMQPQYRQPTYMPPINQMQPQLSPAEMPISLFRFMKEEEATLYAMELNTKGMFVDKQKKVCVIKWCDAYGNSDLKKYKFSDYDEKTEEKSIDTSNFLNKEDINGFVKKEDIENFVKKDDLNDLVKKVSMIEKKIKIKNIFEEKEDNE